MILIAPRNEELAAGYCGALEFINRLPAYRFQAALLAQLKTEGLEFAVDVTMLELLAASAGMGIGEFLVSHSTIPATRFAARQAACLPHSSATPLFHMRHGLVTPRPGGFVCMECIEQDLRSKQATSWFRRAHHLVGVDWCHRHGTQLHRVLDTRPFSAPPHIWRQREKLGQNSTNSLQLSESGGLIERFVALSVWSLEQECPVSSARLKSLLGSRAQANGLRLSSSGSKAALSDLVKSLAPKQWVAAHMPGLAQKKNGEYFSRVDDFLCSATPAAADSYLLAMAALFPSAQAAIKALSKDLEPSEGLAPTNKRQVRGTRYWHGEAWTHYLRARGDHARMAAELDMFPSRLSRQMNLLGLPQLNLKTANPLMEALLDFGEGMSIEESCDLHSVDVQDLEDLLRQASTRLLTAAGQFRRARSRTQNYRYRRKYKKTFGEPLEVAPSP